MARMLKLIASAAVLILAVGCKINLTADIYSSDLRDVAAGTVGLTAPATMAFQVPGADDCAEHTIKITELMTGIMPITPRGCESVEMESFLLADIQVPVLNSEKAWIDSDALFGLLVNKLTDSEDIGVLVAMNVEKYGLLAQRTSEKFHQRINLAESRVTLILNNDQRSTLSFSTKEVFVNAEPAHGVHEHELARRHKAELRLSNVATAYLAKRGAASVFVLKGEQP